MTIKIKILIVYKKLNLKVEESENLAFRKK